MSGVTLAAAEAPLVLTIDVGTSSTRALLYDARGRMVDGVSARERGALVFEQGGAAEDDPLVALQRIERCIDGALRLAGARAGDIAAVALDTYVSNIVPLDRAGRPLGPLLTYADTRNGPDALELQRRLDEAAIHQRTGCLLRTSYWPARLAWYRRTQPDVWREAARWATLGELLEQRLFGTMRVSPSVASWSGLLDRERLAWDLPLLEALRTDVSRFAPLADVDQPLRGLTRPWAARWPALANVPWLPAVGDGAAANIGSGCATPAQVALTVGTTGALRRVRRSVGQVPAGLWCYRVDRRRQLVGGATSEGGNVYSWLRRALYLAGGPAATERALAAAVPDGHGLTLLPFLAGERSPGWAGDVRGVFAGLTLATSQLDLLRAGLEAIAFRIALIAERLLADDVAATQVIASGGALLASPVWMQIIADALGRPLMVSLEAEATGRGCALLALEVLGVLADAADVPMTLGAVYEPDLATTAVYRAAMARQQRLYGLLIGQGWR